MREELQQMCDSLTLEEMVELREYLSDTIIAASKKWIKKSPSRCSTLLGEVADIVGEECIPSFSRIPMYVWARTMVAYQMIREGYTTLEIGKQMRKDHASVTHMKVKMEDALSLPQAYGDIIEVWTKFQKRIRQ